MKSAKYSNKNGNISEQLANSIIRVAYGDAGFWEKRNILSLARSNEDVRSMLESYSNTANSVHELQSEDCPDYLIESALQKLKISKRKQPSFFFDFYNTIFTKPLLSAFAAAVLVAVITVSVFINNGQNLEGYKLADVEKANKEAKYAFTLVNKIFSSTSASLKEDILRDKVSKPINKGVETVNKLFTDKEKKNEN
jgi:hypothetical protein